MSAFLVSEKTLYSALQGVLHCKYSRLYKDVNKDKGIRTVFMALNTLNSLALKVRYNEEPAPGYLYSGIKLSEAPVNKIQCLKSLQCLIYQCSEGEVVKTGLYKKLVEVQNDLQDLIIRDLPEYEQAVWDRWPEYKIV